MDAFYPFIHNPKKKEMEPEPLYIELGPPIPEEPKKEEKEESRVVVIEIL